MLRAGVEINTAVKDAGKAERKAVAQKKAVPGKEKKPSIHERLEINKRIIQEKQGKDKPERGADLGVRTVWYKHNESEVTDDNVASGFFVLNDSASNFYVTNETTYDIIKTYKRK